MKFPLSFLAVLIATLAIAQPDSTRKPQRVRIGAYTGASYQFAINGTKANTNLGNFGFKGYLQPEIGLGIRYQQDTTEFATVILSASRLQFTLASSNIIFASGNEYPIENRIDVDVNVYSMEAAYHRRISKKRNYWSLEAGAGIHVLSWYGATLSEDTVAGPYSVSRSINSPSTFALPSVSLGFNYCVKNRDNKMEYIIGTHDQLYLGKFREIDYEVQYASGNQTLAYYFKWSPVLLMPKVYVMVVF